MDGSRVTMAKVMSPGCWPAGGACIAEKPLLVRPTRGEVLLQEIRRDVERMVAVGAALESTAPRMTWMPFWRIKRPTRPLSRFAGKPLPDNGWPRRMPSSFSASVIRGSP